MPTFYEQLVAAIEAGESFALGIISDIKGSSPQKRGAKAIFFADGRIDRTELEFLLEVRREAEAAVPSFQKLLFEAIRNVILSDGSIDAVEAAWLRSWIFADGKVDADEKHWLKELKLLADKVCPEFMALYNECMAC